MIRPGSLLMMTRRKSRGGPFGACGMGEEAGPGGWGETELSLKNEPDSPLQDSSDLLNT
jgi:hypothetical protein